MDHTTRGWSFPRKHELTRQGVCVCVSLSFVFKAEDAANRSLSGYGGVPGRPGIGSEAFPPAVGTWVLTPLVFSARAAAALSGSGMEGLEMCGGILASLDDCEAS